MHVKGKAGSADTRSFRVELTPTWLAMATLLAGHRPPELDCGFRAVYLGGGHGFTAAVAAAVHPEAEIWWWDPDVRAVESARRLAAAAGLSNLTVHERPDLPDDLGGGPADILIVDALFDAVDDALRSRIDDLMATNLRPGGIACIGYRTVVGWAEVVPVHRLIGRLIARDPRPPSQAVPDVKQTLHDLRDGGAGYLTRRPVVADWLDEVLELSTETFLEHLVRRDMRPLSHAGLVTTMDRLGCGHIGPALADDLPEPDLSAALVELIAEAPSPVAREAFTDLALRRSHRADLFRMGAAPLTARERTRAVGSLEVMAIPSSTPMPDRASRTTPKAAVRRALAEGPVAVERLHDERDRTEPLLRRLLADGFVHPIHSQGAGLDARATDAAARLTEVLTRPPVPPSDRTLVAPAVGSAVSASHSSDRHQRSTLGIS